MNVVRSRVSLVVVAVAGALAVLGAFGAFTSLDIGSTAYDLCADSATTAADGGPVVGATRLWLPIVGASCTYAPLPDVQVQRIVFDWPAAAIAVTGWVLLVAAIITCLRRSSRR